MKKLIIIVCLSLAIGLGTLQSQNLADTSCYVYCELVGHMPFNSQQVYISVNYGADKSYYVGNAKFKEDPPGKIPGFKSMPEALNYMSTNGWEFVDSYVIVIVNANYIHFVLRKRT